MKMNNTTALRGCKLLLIILSSVMANAQVCNNVYLVNSSNEIRSFTNLPASAAFGPALNTGLATGINITSPNALGYARTTGVFYYFSRNIPALEFVAYNALTNTYTKLAVPQGNETFYRGDVTQDGTGYYGLSNAGNLWYYDILLNQWTRITNAASNPYVNQYGANVTTDVKNLGGGDLTFDGAGNLWILLSTPGITRVIKFSAPIPKTAVSTLPANFVGTGNFGFQTNGIAFSDNGELYMTASGTNYLYRLNSNLSVVQLFKVATDPTDLATCNYPSNPLPAMDFGDAPESYQTSESADGPRHLPSFYDAATHTAALMLGSKIDIETNAFPAAPGGAATGDDLNDIDDEEGVTAFKPLVTNTTRHSVTVNVTNTSGKMAALKGWIDFNRNGKFDATEAATATVAPGATSAILTWTNLGGLTVGKLYSRFRIASDGTQIAGPGGLANDGEVEDYDAIYVGYSITGSVFNDGNGLSNGLIDGVKTNVDGSLMAVLYNNTTGKVVDSVLVGTDGNYTLGAPFANNDYAVYITNTKTPVNIGQTAKPAITLPGGWVNTGEGFGTTSDGTVDSKVELGNVAGDRGNINFGIEQAPESYDVEKIVAGAPTPNVTIPLADMPLQGSDPTDQSQKGAWSGKVLAITSLPILDGFQLSYGGHIITQADLDGNNGKYIINNYQPDQLVLTPVNPPGGLKETRFTYAVIDAAGVLDPTPATATIKFTSALPVLFGAIQASIKNGRLIVRWESVAEINNDHFEIEVSKDGQNFQKAGEVLTRADLGNSNTKISYEFSAPMSSGILSALAIAALLLQGFSSKKRNWLAVLLVLFGMLIQLISCSRSNNELLNNKDVKLFVRIAQVDKDGGKSYSKIVRALTEE